MRNKIPFYEIEIWCPAQDDFHNVEVYFRVMKLVWFEVRSALGVDYLFEIKNMSRLGIGSAPHGVGTPMLNGVTKHPPDCFPNPMLSAVQDFQLV